MRGTSLVRFIFVAFLVGVVSPIVTAQPPAQVRKEQISLSEYAARRAELARTIDSGVVLAFGEVEPVVLWPTFFQNPAFQYLTGLSESDAILVMVKRNGATTSTIFVPNRTRSQQRWVGKRTPVAD